MVTLNLLELVRNLDGGDILAISIAVASLVEISPIKINPWTWLSKIVANAMGISELRRDMAKMRNDINELDRKIDELKIEEENKQELREALSARRRILKFNDELLQGIRHSKEMFNNILEDITNYENYCRLHPEFVNQRAVMAESNIKKVYQQCMGTHDFL